MVMENEPDERDDDTVSAAELLLKHRDAAVAAVSWDGLFVPMPPEVGIVARLELEARSALDIVPPEERSAVIAGWGGNISSKRLIRPMSTPRQQLPASEKPGTPGSSRPADPAAERGEELAVGERRAHLQALRPQTGRKASLRGVVAPAPGRRRGVAQPGLPLLEKQHAMPFGLQALDQRAVRGGMPISP